MRGSSWYKAFPVEAGDAAFPRGHVVAYGFHVDTIMPAFHEVVAWFPDSQQAERFAKRRNRETKCSVGG